jgi:hypothetical protein
MYTCNLNDRRTDPEPASVPGAPHEPRARHRKYWTGGNGKDSFGVSDGLEGSGIRPGPASDSDPTGCKR